MPSRSEIESWACDAFRAAGGQADTNAVRQYIWLSHEASLRAAGPQFFCWQIDVDRALYSLKRRGLIRRVRNSQDADYWQIVGDMTNAFEAMCLKASEDEWCWNLGCTTCGNQHLRYGLYQIASGRHPATSEWDTLDTRVGDPLQWRDVSSTVDWPDLIKEQLAQTLSGVSLKAISRQCKFPDWLGYVGVVLHMVGQDDEFARHVTRQWLPELRSMTQPGSMSRNRLDQVPRNREPLRWHHIDGMELDLRPEYRRQEP